MRQKKLDHTHVDLKYPVMPGGKKIHKNNIAVSPKGT